MMQSTSDAHGMGMTVKRYATFVKHSVIVLNEKTLRIKVKPAGCCTLLEAEAEKLGSRVLILKISINDVETSSLHTQERLRGDRRRVGHGNAMETW
jgi:hypothetical protein